MDGFTEIAMERAKRAFEDLENPSDDIGIDHGVSVAIVVMIQVACIFLTHIVIANRFKRPYFVLHVIVNAINLYICTSGAIEGLMNPQSSVINEKRGPEGQTYIALILALHAYHPIFFRTGRMDWIHHTPVYILCFLMLSVPSGTIFKLQSSILTGLPGGLEYVCLVLEGQKVMSRATVKHYSSMINTWFRLPMYVL